MFLDSLSVFKSLLKLASFRRYQLGVIKLTSFAMRVFISRDISQKASARK